MSDVTLQFSGLAEFRDALRRLPEELGDEGGEIVEDAVEVTAAQLVQSYPLGESGNLRGGVRKTIERSPHGAIGIVKSTSPHAHLWEFGTQNRQTRLGWNRGRSPSHYGQGLVGIATRNRQRMVQKLIALVRRAGFQVNA